MQKRQARLEPMSVACPVEPEPLSAYLNGLGDLDEALESFAKLADSLAYDINDISYPLQCSSSLQNNFKVFDTISNRFSQSPFESGCSSPISSYSGSVSPSSSDNSYSSDYSSSFACQSQFEDQQISSNNMTRNKSKRLTKNKQVHFEGSLKLEISRSRNGRRSKNASAAEKYRRRLKGREFCLRSEMESEEEKNDKLKREYESKLALYREFVDLLARNTSFRDGDLANFGLNSIKFVLNNLSSFKKSISSSSELIANELTQNYVKFQNISNQIY